MIQISEIIIIISGESEGEMALKRKLINSDVIRVTDIETDSF